MEVAESLSLLSASQVHPSQTDVATVFGSFGLKPEIPTIRVRDIEHEFFYDRSQADQWVRLWLEATDQITIDENALSKLEDRATIIRRKAIGELMRMADILLHAQYLYSSAPSKPPLCSQPAATWYVWSTRPSLKTYRKAPSKAEESKLTTSPYYRSPPAKQDSRLHRRRYIQRRYLSFQHKLNPACRTFHRWYHCRCRCMYGPAGLARILHQRVE